VDRLCDGSPNLGVLALVLGGRSELVPRGGREDGPRAGAAHLRGPAPQLPGVLAPRGAREELEYLRRRQVRESYPPGEARAVEYIANLVARELHPDVERGRAPGREVVVGDFTVEANNRHVSPLRPRMLLRTCQHGRKGQASAPCARYGLHEVEGVLERSTSFWCRLARHDETRVLTSTLAAAAPQARPARTSADRSSTDACASSPDRCPSPLPRTPSASRPRSSTRPASGQRGWTISGEQRRVNFHGRRSAVRRSARLAPCDRLPTTRRRRGAPGDADVRG
jgi:hypothetical protein